MENSYQENNILHLLLIGDIDDYNIEQVTQQVFDSEADDSIKEIDIHINSAGGSIVDGFSLIGAMTNSSKKIVTINDGVALSMGAIIFVAGDERRMKDYSILMLHNPSIWGMEETEFEKGSKEQKSLQKFKESLINIMQTRTKLTKAQLNKYFNEETWLNASECKELGIADKVIKTKKKPQKNLENINEYIMACTSLMPNQNVKPKIIPMKEVTNLLGLPVDASEAQIFKEISNLKEKAKDFENKLKTVEKEKDNLTKELVLKGNEIENLKNEMSQKIKDAEKLQATISDYERKFAENAVENAIKDGKIAEDAKDKMIEMAQRDLNQFNEFIASIPTRPVMKNIETKIENKQEDERASWTYLDWSQKDSKGLAEMRKSNPEKFDKLLNDYINSENK